jgi:hypothetical protein
MSGKNRRAKEELIRRYGAECFIDRLHLRDDKDRKYTGKGQYKRMKMLTYHHIKMRKDGGKANVENGALLSAENHSWFHQQPMARQREMNDMFQELKRELDHIGIEYVDDLETPIKVNAVSISVTKDKHVIIERLRRDEEREFQRQRKEYEDR